MKNLIEGAVVHYVLSKNRHISAIIIRVWSDEGTCNLVTFNDSDKNGLEILWKTSIIFSENPVPGTWHWIERE